MTRPFLNTLLAASAVFALAACNSAEDAAAPLEGEPVAAVSAPDGQSWTDVATVSESDGYILGNPDAPIKLVEYASHTCGHCGTFSQDASEPLREKYISTGKVSYEIRNQIHDPIDLTFATLARCAGPEAFHPLAEQGWQNLETFFQTAQANQSGYEAAAQQTGAARMVGIAQATGMLDFFTARGLSEDQARSCLADQTKIEGIVANSQKQSTDLDVTGTPTFFINGNKVQVNTWAALEPLLQQAGAR